MIECDFIDLFYYFSLVSFGKSFSIIGEIYNLFLGSFYEILLLFALK